MSAVAAALAELEKKHATALANKTAAVEMYREYKSETEKISAAIEALRPLLGATVPKTAEVVVEVSKQSVPDLVDSRRYLASVQNVHPRSVRTRHVMQLSAYASKLANNRGIKASYVQSPITIANVIAYPREIMEQAYRLRFGVSLKGSA